MGNREEIRPAGAWGMRNGREGATMTGYPAADTILTGGKILTVNAAFDIVPALAIRDGRVLAIGGDAEIAALAGPGTRRIDLAGRTVIPGLIDAHCHMLATGLLLGDLVLHDC